MLIIVKFKKTSPNCIRRKDFKCNQLGKAPLTIGLILLALPIQALVSVCDGSPRPAVSGSPTPCLTASCSFVLCPPILFHNERSQGCLFAAKSQIPLALILGLHKSVIFSMPSSIPISGSSKLKNIHHTASPLTP